MRLVAFLALALSAPLYAEKPVVVELFTSEGCSSCPPADELLMKLDHAPGVLVLSEHVDYWNSLGWKDPFSNHQFSARQEQYAHAFHLDSNYTPQMVVDGRTEFVGNNEGKAREAIRTAAQTSKADVTLAWHDGKLAVKVDHAPAGTLQVMVAIAESGLQSSVARGENSGRTLLHTSVVRWLHAAGQVRNGAFEGEVPVTLARDWKRENLKAIVFVQDVATRKIEGAAAAPFSGGEIGKS